MLETIVTNLERGVARGAAVSGVAGEVIIERTRRAAAHLGSRGWRGARVAVLLPGGSDFAVAFLSVVLSGNVAVLADPGLPQAAVAELLAETGAVAVVTDPERAASLGELAVPVLLVEGLVAGPAGALEVPGGEQVCCLLSTSGVTGRRCFHAKTVRQLGVEVAELRERTEAGPADVFVSNVPWSHLYGLDWGLLLPAYAGSAIETRTGAPARALLDLVETRRATVLCTVPLFYRHLSRLTDVDGRRLSTVRWFVSSGDRLLDADAEAFRRMAGRRIMSVYGMTETGALFVGPAPSGGDLGAPMSYLHVRIEEVDGIGRLLVRGPNTPDPDRWFDTGDAVRSADGRFWYVGRAKRVVKRGGRTVCLAEVERVILESGLVDDVHVRADGVDPDRPAGEPRIRACVVPIGDADTALRQLGVHCRAKLAPWEVPSTIEAVPCVPRDERGKVRAS